MTAATHPSSTGTPGVALAVAYYRAPLSNPELARGDLPLPPGAGALLRIAAGDQELLKQASKTGNLTQREIFDAATFFVRQVFFARDATHYRVLGLAPAAGADDIKEHYRLLMKLFHPDRGGTEEQWIDRFAVRVNGAYAVLRNPDTRAAYDAGIAAPAAAAPRERPSRTIRAADTKGRHPAPDATGGDGVTLPPFVRRHFPKLVLGGTALVALIVVGGIMAFEDRPVAGTGAIGSALSAKPAERSGFGKIVNALFARRTDRDALADELGRWRDEKLAAAPERAAAKEEGGEPSEAAATIEAAPPGVTTVSATAGDGPMPVAVRTGDDRGSDRNLAVAPAPGGASAGTTKGQAMPAAHAASRQASTQPRTQTASLQPPAPVEQRPESQRTAAATRDTVRSGPAVAAATIARATPLPSTARQPSPDRARSDPSQSIPAKTTVAAATAPAAPTKPSDAGAPVTAAVSAVPLEAPRPATRAESPTVVAAVPATAAPNPATAAASTGTTPAVAPDSTRPGLGDLDLERLIARFVASYERGDLEQFMTLFHDSVRTGDKGDGKAKTRKDYEELFTGTLARRMAIDELHWEKDGNAAKGLARFVVRVMSRDNQQVREYAGGIRIEVAPADGALTIRGLQHTVNSSRVLGAGATVWR